MPDRASGYSSGARDRSFTAPASAGPGTSIAVVLKGYPRLSETFIAQEIRALERAGFDLSIYSLRHPTDPGVHPVHREIKAPVAYLPEYLWEEPGRVLAGWRQARRLPGYPAARRRFLRDLCRDRTANRIRRFGQACVLAAELASNVRHLYAHFLHTPASVARYAALMTGLPWSVSAHAKDIWTTPDWEKREKLDDADWAVTCTAVGQAHLATHTRHTGKVQLIYHGIDLQRFPAPQARSESRDGTNPAEPVRILSVGRAVEKKGYDDLLRALALLPDGLHWSLTHIGGGELRSPLQTLARKLGLADRITWLGAQSQETVLAHYRKADIFTLASRVTDSGDRDGLPNVLMEAQSQNVVCLATNVSAIPELILPGETGVLVPPQDPPRLAKALENLIREPEKRARLADAGAVRVRRHFAMEAGIKKLLLKLMLNQTAQPTS